MRKFVSIISAAVLALTSCVIDQQELAPERTHDGQRLTVRVAGAPGGVQGSATRAVEAPGSVAPGVVELMNGHIFVLNGANVVVDYAPLEVDAEGGVASADFESVPVGSRVFVVANLPAGAPSPSYLTSLGEIKAVAGEIATQTRYDRATLANRGGRTVAVPGVRNATVEVELAPVISRLEIGPIEGTGDVEGFTVTGVYLDRYYPRFTLGGGGAGAMVYQQEGWALHGLGDDGEWPAVPSADGWAAEPGEGRVWAYNVAAGRVPGLVVRLENVNVGGSVLDRPQLLRVGGFDVPEFEPGTIYRTGKITFDETLEAEVSYLHPHVDAPVTLTLLQDAEWFAVAPAVPRVKVRAVNPGSGAADVKIRLEISPDRVEGFDWSTGTFSTAWLTPVVKQTATVTVPSGAIETIAIDVDLPEPGFYRCRVVDVDSGVVLDSFNIGRDPEQIVSPRDARPDFEEFWAQAREELDAVAPQYQLTLLPEQSNSVRDVYRVEMRSLGGVVIRGIYARPKGAGPHPAIIQYAGYGGGSSSINASSNPGYAEFHLSTRGQGISTPNVYGEWIAYGIDDKNNHYYRGGFMDLVRGVDFLVSRPEVDARYIFATGGSQGGAYTMAAAALDDRIAAAAPTIPFLSDYADYVKITPFVATKIMPRARAQGIGEEELLRTMSYFDVKNLAGWITCPVIMGFGLQDETCPPHTNFAGYNQITSPKSYYAYPQNAHSVGGDWGTIRNNFFNSVRTGNT